MCVFSSELAYLSLAFFGAGVGFVDCLSAPCFCDKSISGYVSFGFSRKDVSDLTTWVGNTNESMGVLQTNDGDMYDVRHA